MMTATLTFGPVPFMADSDSRKKPVMAASALTSVELLARAQTGDELALNELFARYLPRLRKWAHGRLPVAARSGLDTQDMVQDAIARVVPRLASFEPLHDGGFYGYLRTAVQHRIQDQITWARRRPTDALASDRPATGPSPIEQAIGGETLERYEAALQRLPKVDREAIVLRIELGLPYTEIAQALGKPSVPATHVAVSRALVKLAKEMSRAKHD
jgi:RNA polymerase sigma-70 factor, ECF subfamily